MSTPRLLLTLSAGLTLVAIATTSEAHGLAPQDAASLEAPASEAAFPVSTAIAEGVSPESLGKLHELVQGFVDDDEIVGAELLVIKNGRAILHEGYGLKDQEQGLGMGTGNVFCVRSMTKPLIGTSILMLANDKQLELGDLVSKYLPDFGAENTQDITIEQLLSHSSGLPMSFIMSADLTSLEGIQAVARLGAGCTLEFEPGTDFNYSDLGTDTLTAVIEVASGMPAADYVRTRLFEPLGMQSSTCVMTEDHALRAHACCKYNGSRGTWTRFWGPNDDPLFPFFLGSQGLYSTLEDYARFLEFWMSKGRSREQRLLRARFARKALSPSPFDFPGATSLSGALADYGYLMQLWLAEQVETDEGERKQKPELIAFGHSGSDGTYSWAFPEQKAIVLYFTQSRGNTTGLRVEEALSELFLGVPFDANQLAPPFEQYLGYYAEDDDHRYQAVILDGKDLALEAPGKRLVQLMYAGEDRWKFRVRPDVVLEFERSAAGEVTGFHIGEPDENREFRFRPKEELPTVDEVIARVRAAHRIHLLEELGPLQRKSSLKIEKLDIEGEVTSLVAWPGKFRVDSNARGQFERVAFDGEVVWYESSTKAREELSGLRAEAMRGENPFAIYGDWREWYPKIEVIQRLKRGEYDLVLVRLGDTSAPAATLFIDWASGRVVRTANVSVVEGMGRIGQQTLLDDFREVDGISLPFKTTVILANPMIGDIVTTIESFELGAELAAGTFQLLDG